MSEPISVSIPHRLGREEALRRIQGGFGTMRAHLASVISDQEEWGGNVLRFRIRGLGQNANGSIAVLDHSVKIDVDLPWLLAKIAEGFIPAVQRETSLLLEKNSGRDKRRIMSGRANHRNWEVSGTVAKSAKEDYDQAKETAPDVARSVQNGANVLDDLFRRRTIEERPYTAAVSALAVGWVIGRM